MPSHTYLEFYKGIPNVGERTLVAQTCDACGLILGSKHYQRTHRNTWPRTCKTCISRRYRQKNPDVDAKLAEARKAEQAKTQDTATDFNKFWTLADLDKMVQLKQSGMTHKKIAVEMNRTLYSIQGAFARFGLSNGWPTRDEWLFKFE
jgi:hypothetical protein